MNDSSRCSRLGAPWGLALWLWLIVTACCAQINTDRVMMMGRNALYYEDYVLSIQRFNHVISAKPYLSEPYFYRGLAKFYLEDYAGAEGDCSSAIDLNPYVKESFELRALCRINTGRYADAVDDYRRTIELSPLDRSIWYNLVLCHLELKDYAQADSALNVMIRNWPKETSNYTLKAQVALASGDTLSGESWVDRALEVDAYCGTAWSMKAMLQMTREEYEDAENGLDRSILQTPKNAGLYINRALCRFHRRNLRGAMTDYDTALELEPGNYLGHYNRGLLRAQVGDDNRAIEDFDFVLEQEPDNMLVLYNRALLLSATGDYKGAIRDISAVIEEYPEFWAGYQARAEAKRRLGDVYGAERDEFKVLKASMEARTGKKRSITRTRKKSERNIEDYNKLVEADEDTPKNEYESEYRGRVQDRAVELQPMPMFVLTYFPRQTSMQRYAPYSKWVEQYNEQHRLPFTLCLGSQETVPTSQHLQTLFDDIAIATEKIEAGKDVQNQYFRRAMANYHLRDFEGAMTDLDSLIDHGTPHPMAYYLRAQVRLSMLDVSASAPSGDTRLGYLVVLRDLDHCSALAPDFPYSHYSRGNVYIRLREYYEAQRAYSEALALDARLPQAYYNRGISYLLGGDVPSGLSDLSQAGEFGLYSAYNLIKRYSTQKK